MHGNSVRNGKSQTDQSHTTFGHLRYPGSTAIQMEAPVARVAEQQVLLRKYNF